MTHMQEGAVDDYVATLDGTVAQVIAHMYDTAQQHIPHCTQGQSYNMPALLYKGTGLLSVLANKDFLSVYPFCNLERLNVDIVGYETTKGSIHFSLDQPISDELLVKILDARRRMIDTAK